MTNDPFYGTRTQKEDLCGRPAGDGFPKPWEPLNERPTDPKNTLNAHRVPYCDLWNGSRLGLARPKGQAKDALVDAAMSLETTEPWEMNSGAAMSIPPTHHP